MNTIILSIAGPLVLIIYTILMTWKPKRTGVYWERKEK